MPPRSCRRPEAHGLTRGVPFGAPSHPNVPAVQIRILRLQSRSPLAGVVLLALVLAILAVVVTAGMALLAGAAVVGGAAMLVRRVLGGPRLRAGARDPERVLLRENEVFPLGSSEAERRLPPVRAD